MKTLSFSTKKLTLLASVMCMSLIGTACTDKEVVAQETNESSTDTTVAANEAPEVVVVDTETTVEAGKQVEVETDAEPALSAGEAPEGAEKEFWVSDIKMISGDSFSAVDENGKRITVKLSGIEAPKIGEPLGQESADALRACIEIDKAQLTVQTDHATDKQGRTLAEVFSDPHHCNLSQVGDGMAWMYEGENDNVSGEMNAIYKDFHDEAQENKLGVWALYTTKPE